MALTQTRLTSQHPPAAADVQLLWLGFVTLEPPQRDVDAHNHARVDGVAVKEEAVAFCVEVSVRVVVAPVVKVHVRVRAAERA
eukprot:357058-Chlamydomonas_euryale.AAC.4